VHDLTSVINDPKPGETETRGGGDEQNGK